MKKFSRILLCLLLCFVSVGLFACNGNTPDPFFQSSAPIETVVGNGGLSVQSNGYLYFVNGYKTSEKMAQENKQNDSYNLGALLVAKLDENGNVYTEEDGQLKDEYSRVMSDKLCGFEATSLYIYNDYLYFTSPCQENEKGGGWANLRVDFYRIKLNKTGNVERIYQTNVNNDKIDFAFYGNNEAVYIMLTETVSETVNNQSKDTLNLYKIDATKTKNNVTKLEESKTISSIYLSKDSNYISYVIEADNGYDFKIVNVLTGDTKVDNRVDTCNLEYISNNYVYFTQDDISGQEKKKLYKASLHANQINPEYISYKFNDTLYYSAEDYILAVNNDDILLYDVNVAGNRRVLITDDGATINILGFANGSVIYADGNNNIKAVSLQASNNAENIKTIASELTGLNKTYIDFNSNKLYFYKTVKTTDTVTTTNEYLHQISLLDENGEAKFIGKLNKEDIPEKETEQ